MLGFLCKIDFIINQYNNIFGAITAIVGAEMLYRFFLFLKEYLWFRKHYARENRVKNMLSFCFKFSNFSRICLVLFLISLPYTEKTYIFKQLHLVPTWIILRWIQLSRNHIDLADFIREQTGIDYASGLALNYFHGYFNLVLPHNGDDTKGITERISDYENKEGCEFALKKLVVLVPQSLHTKAIIESDYLERASPLEDLVRDRAGVSRPYTNQVYRFKKRMLKPGETEEKIFYIALEGATPLLSFYEAMNSGPLLMKSMKTEIWRNFYKCIKKYLNENPNTKKKCELFYCNDEKTDVGYQLMQFIEHIWKNQYSSVPEILKE